MNKIDLNKKEMKDRIRDEAKEKRARLGKEKRYLESLKVCEKITSLKEYKEAKNILSFMNFRDEIEIDILNKKIVESGKKLYLPRVNKLHLEIIEYGEEMKISDFGIKEPIGDAKTPELDMIIVPGLAFDNKGNRLGYGKGYYDRLFEEYSGVLKVAPIFSIQLFEYVPTEEHDIKMDMIILKDRVIDLRNIEKK